MAARPGIVGELLGAAAVVVVEEDVVVVEVLEVVDVMEAVLWDVVVVGSGSLVTVPITQYDLLVSSAGQVIPGFNFWRSSTESPQLLAKVAQVSLLPGAVEKAQSTARRERTDPAETNPGRTPAAAMN